MIINCKRADLKEDLEEILDESINPDQKLFYRSLITHIVDDRD